MSVILILMIEPKMIKVHFDTMATCVGSNFTTVKKYDILLDPRAKR